MNEITGVYWNYNSNDGSYDVGIILDGERDIVVRHFDLTEIAFSADKCKPLTVYDYADKLVETIWP